MRLKILKVLIIGLIIMGMHNIPLVQAGKPQNVIDGLYGHRIKVWDESTWEFSEDEPTYILYGWAYLEEEWKVFPMPIKLNVRCEEIEFKVKRFTRQNDIEGAVSPTFYFYVLFDPYTFSVGEHFLETYYMFHGECMLDFSHHINVLPASGIL
ncbi:hypothetical protein DSAG12_03312 [Promethearchaeum syntrophicum]|uniref:Uncharacterized protein n=1 Tax=Promethearchaeum syntrophicum TaxID=2594042 RepID=A0A5B9DEM6_9ARCH|nr:hypothetical protein [Candidatus Prometheoarchaeum syntrophicum]QEE17475.1 hypothetical protein DSAG12_03312 [Candidatus Prometheoarchaeum syntrophicum]